MKKATIARRLVLGSCIALLTFLLGIAAFVGWEDIKGSPASDQLSLHFLTETPILKVGETPTIKLFITNNDSETVTLVMPGDGSESAWRTPVVWSSTLEAGDLRPHSTSPERISRCGNIMSLKWDEVFRLAPGESKEIGSTVWLRPFQKPGSYRVKFFYVNQPWMIWQGRERRRHHPIAMWRVQNSTECNLSSNEVLFTVTE